MKKLVLYLIISTSYCSTFSQIVLNEFETTGLERIELKNISSQTVDVNNFILCSYPVYDLISNLAILSGNYLMAPGDIIVLNGHPLLDTDGELAIYLNYNFTNPNAIIDYVEWGSSFHVRSTIAVQAGIWTTGDFVPSPTANISLEFDGMGDASTNWHVQMNPTFGMENGFLSVPENDFQTSISITHNAINNFVFISSMQQNYPLSTVSIIHLNGNMVLNEELNNVYEWRLDVKLLDKGTYLVRVGSNQHYMTEKIIVY